MQADRSLQADLVKSGTITLINADGRKLTPLGTITVSLDLGIITVDHTWYGGKSKGPGRPPKWVEQLLAGKNTNKEVVNTAEEKESSDKQAETEVAQMNIKRGDPPMMHENVDTMQIRRKSDNCQRRVY